MWPNSADHIKSFIDHTQITYPVCLDADSVGNISYSTKFDRFIVVGADGIIYHKRDVRALDDLNTAINIIDSLLSLTAMPPDQQILQGYTLRQNYPNPFNPHTDISFELPKTQQVKIIIYDLQGKLVRKLLDQTQTAGYNRVRWKGMDETGNPVPSGIYFYIMQAGKFSETKKMILIR